MEYENGKETLTFSTVTKPANLPEEKDRKEGRRRKKPAKVKRDRERREAWMERRRTVEERLVAEVPAAAPVTVPAPKTPDGTCRTMVTSRTPEEAERRSPVEERSMAEEPVAAPVTDPAPVPAGGGALEEAFPEAYLRRIGSESREAWGERTRTVKERRDRRLRYQLPPLLQNLPLRLYPEPLMVPGESWRQGPRVVVQEGTTPPWTGILEASMATGKCTSVKVEHCCDELRP